MLVERKVDGSKGRSVMWLGIRIRQRTS